MTEARVVYTIAPDPMAVMDRPPFDGTTYAARRRRLAAAAGSGVALFVGNEESAMNYADNIYPFRQDSSFLYFFGLDRAGLAALVDLDAGTATLFGDDASLDDVVWMGPQTAVDEMAAWVAVERTAARSALAGAVSAALGAGRPVHWLPPYRASQAVELAALLGRDVEMVAAGASQSLMRAIVAQRAIKSDEEIAEIDRAVAISAEMHLAVMREARPGMVERELAARVEAIAQARGGRLSFPTILTVHGETLHNHYRGNTLESGRLLLVDCGAEAPSHYAGDLSRTFPVDREFTGRQKEIYQVALAAHESAVARLAPGVPFREVHLCACREIAAGLGALGLMKGDPDEAVAAGAHAFFFQCGTGHMMGLDVHDMENLGEDLVGYDSSVERSRQFGLKSLRLARPLEPGFVLTVEPGIYFIPELFDRWGAEKRFAEFIDYARVEAYRDFGGLRSEEEFVVTDDGARRLGPDLPKAIDDVEAVRSGG